MPRLAPPQIPGLVYQRDLGAGGFADVYLYQSISPKRQVAVKVLRATDMNDRMARRFTAEADVMAELEHPHIVTVYDAGIAGDGRPYIEMAYYPYESLADALRRGPLSVQDVLRIGVQLASAVETAHRAGLLHRDIKPANVLTDKYGSPVLTDFGIASRLNEDEDEDASLSVPWAPPEAMFSTSPVDQRSDIYSLGATLWQLLVGRAPFEIPGGDNRPASMMVRTRDLPAPSTGRGDVPASLERLLQTALNKDPRFRPTSAADFARALNAVEEELRFRPTPFTVARDDGMVAPGSAREDAGDDNRTRRKAAPQVVQAQPVAQSVTRTGVPMPPPAAAPSAFGKREEPGATVRRGATAVVDAQTTRRPTATVVTPSDDVDEDDGEESPGRSKAWLIVVLVVVVALIAGGTWWLTHRSGGEASAPEPSATRTRTQGPQMGNNLPPGTPTVTCTRDGATVTCTWTYSQDLTTDTYQVAVVDQAAPDPVTPDQASIKPDDKTTWSEATQLGAGQYCVVVRVMRSDSGQMSQWSAKGCA